MPSTEGLYRVKNLLIRPHTGEIEVDGVATHVEPNLMKVLVYLVENAPRTISQEELLTNIWPDSVVEQSTIHRRMSQLRGILGDDARNPDFILTVPKQGYRMVPPVEKITLNSETAASGGSSRKVFAFTIAIIAITAIAALFFQSQKTTPETDSAEARLAAHSIAVLPFIDLSEQTDNNQFVRGLNETILDELVQLNTLKVASRTSSDNAFVQNTEVTELADLLGVAYIMEGSVQRVDDRLRITAQLIRAEDNFHVWSRIFDATARAPFAEQNDLAETIVRLSFSALDFDIHRRYGWGSYGPIEGIDPRALKLFFDGEDEFRKFNLGEGGDIEIGERLIRQATAIDPDFFAPYSSLANIYIHRKMGTLSLAESMPLARASINAAKSLGPGERGEISFQEAQFYLYLDWNYEAAETQLERTLVSEAKCAWCYIFLADMNIRQGQLNAARSHLESAISISRSVDNEESQLWIARGELLSALGESTRAIQAYETALKATTAPRSKARILLLQAAEYSTDNNTEEVRQLLGKATQLDNQVEPELYIFLNAFAGNEQKARMMLLNPSRPLHQYGYLALAYQLLAEPERAIGAIEQGIRNHDNFISRHLRQSPLFQPFRSTANYPDLLQLLVDEEGAEER